MQRSRRALLQRRAALEKNSVTGNKRLYKVSLSLVLLLWGVFFLLNSLISHGNGYNFKAGVGAVTGESIWHEAGPDSSEVVHHRVPLSSSSDISDHNVQDTSISESEPVKPSTGPLVTQHNKGILPTTEDKIGEENIELGNKVEKGTSSRSNKVETSPKNERMPRVAPPGLDEFKSRAITSKEKPVSSKGTVIHRVEPGGKAYNYAAATKGAKVLDFNKEAKGASNILDKDKDRYLRNPCSAEEKFVVIELSEETLVDTIELANFEHYSSNLKDFELLSSMVYPTDNWDTLGNFTAANVKHAQRFALQEPKWARYLKLNLLNHYGTEFYCTLSLVEVYGVDAVERMLEDMISPPNNRLELEEQNTEQMPVQESTDDVVDVYQEVVTEMDSEANNGSQRTKQEAPKHAAPDPALETKPPQVGRMPGDTVLKILMQKVQALDVNFSVLERYLEELNSRYGRIFKEFDDEIAEKDNLLEKITREIRNLEKRNDVLAGHVGELLFWKASVSSQMDQLVEDNLILRLEMEKLRDHQVDVESRDLVVIFMSFVFGCLAAIKLFTNMVLSICRIRSYDKFCQTSSGWLLLLLSSGIIAFILVL